MEFEFDTNKSKSNREKHGIDFLEAQDLWEDPDRVEIPTKYLDEPRCILIGKVKDKYWSAVFTYRKNRIRIISVRKARKNEKEIYEG